MVPVPVPRVLVVRVYCVWLKSAVMVMFFVMVMVVGEVVVFRSFFQEVKCHPGWGVAVRVMVSL